MLPDRTQKYGFAIGVVIIVLYLCPFFILGQDSYVTIHDNLDSLLALRTVLVQSGKVFQTNSPIEQIMNGLPRECLHSALDVVGWLFLFFRPLTAYVINTLIVRIVAFVGMFLLLRTHFIKDKNAYMIISGTSLCFALLPFYSMFGLSIAGQPLLLYAFLNLLGKEKRFSDFVIILFFPFYSSLVGAGVFILFALGILFIYDYFKNKRINYRFLVGLFVLAATYAVVEYNLVYLTFFNDGFVSHRSELDLAQHSWDLKNAVKVGLVNFLLVV